MSNPLLDPVRLPAFDRIRPEHLGPALDRVFEDNARVIEAAACAPPDWDLVVEPLESAGDRLARIWSPVSHLHGVRDSAELREVYEAALPRLSEYYSMFGQHRGLFDAYRRLADSAAFAGFEPARRTAIEHALRDFRLSGIDLPEPQQERFRAISARLSERSNRFSQHVLDATEAFELPVPEARLAGLPDADRQKAVKAGEERGHEQPVITLDGPTYQAVMMHADDRDLRQEVYYAWTTRASDQGPSAGGYDNAPLIEEILALRKEQAELLGFGSWAERQLADRMAGSVDEVLDFLRDLARRARPQAEREYQELADYARNELGLELLQAWDVGYASERLRQTRYSISEEALRPYFPVDRVVSGLFEIVSRLFDIRVEEVSGWATWHPSVRTFEIHSNAACGGAQLVGRFYLDLFARRHKQGGAWMGKFVGRRRTPGGSQVPVAFLTCNFGGPGPDRPALLTHNEVTTLFHEFGHGLHHMLTRVEVASVAGINGVPWDAVELPSQFLENWCWHPESLALIAAHYETGEPLPDEMLERLLAARNFQSAIAMVRQLEFALFDFRLHHEYRAGDGGQVRRILNEVRDEVAVIRPPENNRFENAFGHIFSGGYAAGYYSYLWAEVLSADAFSRFEEEGIFAPAAGTDFLKEVLARGGSEPPSELFRRFRGRDPDVSALLRHSGIVKEAAPT
ncbi:MAG: M3 family peptidase [Gammaproteobacteria bacterium]|nr:MAG: M3 family peptidase [Gammaproteobacteria bacterium]